MIELLLPRTDAGAFVQLAAVLGVGAPLLVWVVRRGFREWAWLLGGLMVFVLGFFALRTVH